MSQPWVSVVINAMLTFLRVAGTSSTIPVVLTPSRKSQCKSPRDGERWNPPIAPYMGLFSLVKLLGDMSISPSRMRRRCAIFDDEALDRRASFSATPCAMLPVEDKEIVSRARCPHDLGRRTRSDDNDLSTGLLCPTILRFRAGASSLWPPWELFSPACPSRLRR